MMMMILGALTLHAQQTTPLQKFQKFVSNINAFNGLFPQENIYLHFDNTGCAKEKNISPFAKLGLDLESGPGSSISLYVVDNATVYNDGNHENYLSYLLLSSDLKGCINRPSIFRIAKLLSKKETLKDFGNVQLQATFYNQNGEWFKANAVSDTASYYAVKIPNCDGDWTLIINTSKNGKPKNCNVTINRWFSLEPRPLSFREITLNQPETEKSSNLTYISLPDSLPHKKKVEFRNNSTCKQFTVSGEGITPDGKPICN